MVKAYDLTGKVFQWLTVIQANGRTSDGKKMWLCKCVCGTEVTVRSSHLISGHSKSCGCLKGPDGAENRKLKRKKPMITEHPLYFIWKGMKKRCLSKTDHRYELYGGRGITICERWLTFENFAADMGERPSPNHSIDRIDNDGNYEPGNCRWATVAEQARNRRTNVYVEYKGEKMILADAAALAGLDVTFAGRRIRQGIPLDKPVKGRNPTNNGESK